MSAVAVLRAQRAQCVHCLLALVENADLLLINPVVMLIFMIFPSAHIIHLFFSLRFMIFHELFLFSSLYAGIDAMN